MALQTSFQADLSIGVPGQWYDISDTDAASRAIKVSAVPFGAAVVRADSDTSCRLPDDGGLLGSATTAADNPFQGIVLAQIPDPLTVNTQVTLPVGFPGAGYMPPQSMASLAKHGRLYVVPEVAVTQGDKVYYRATLTDAAADPQVEALGSLGNTDDGGNCIEIVGAKWFTSGEAGGLCVLQLTGV